MAETQPLAAGSRLAFNPLRSFHFRHEQEYVFADRFAPPSYALTSFNFLDKLPGLSSIFHSIPLAFTLVLIFSSYLSMI